jgi:DNA-binding transcriptional LysR family regulator
VKLNDLDLNKLMTFLAVAETGAVGKAAARLGRTSSAVSQSVSGLEGLLGQTLFDRVGRKLVLTRGGALLRERMGTCRELLERTLGDLRDSREGVSGVVRLGTYLGFPRQQLAQLLSELGRRHPRASVRVVHAPGRELTRRLEENRLDFALSFGARAPLGTRLSSTRLFSQELVLLARTPHLSRGFSLEELERTPIVDYYQSDPLIDRWLAHHFPRRAVQVPVRFWAATTDLVLELLQAGAGAGVLPRHVARAALRGRGATRLIELGPSERPMRDHIWLDEPRGAYRDATLRAFRDIAIEVLQAIA